MLFYTPLFSTRNSILHPTVSTFLSISTGVAIALTLQVPGRLDLIMKGALVGRFFLGSVI